MIRIARGAEPESLRKSRYVHLARARLAVKAGQKPSCDGGYSVARNSLFETQNAKCAYCEMLQLSASHPVEHFRPKAKAIRGDGSESPGYWWLAWTWDNLLFSCGTCNGMNRKGNHFGLESGSTPLVAHEQPPAGEISSLLTPFGGEDPIDHIIFRKLSRWQPFPRNGSSRGKYTIAKLGLDDGPLLDHYESHVTRIVQPPLGLFRGVIRKQDPVEITRAWRRLVRMLFGLKMPFQALSYDVVDFSIDLTVRQQWRLELPRPGSKHSTTAPSQEHKPDGLEMLSPDLALEVCALGLSPGEKRLSVLKAVRVEQPTWTIEQLAKLFEVLPKTIYADLAQL